MLEDLDAALSPIQEKASAISRDMKTAANRMKVISDIQSAVADCQTYKAVHDKYIKIGWKSRQEAEMYGICVNRNGMCVCSFHNDKNPSMKVDKRFHCSACGADGDAVDFVSRLYGLLSKEVAMKLADDFGISYDSRQKPTIRPKIQEPTKEQKYRQEEN